MSAAKEVAKATGTVMPRRRKTDREPQRETYLQERVNRLDEELLLVRAENARLRKELSKQGVPKTKS